MRSCKFERTRSEMKHLNKHPGRLISFAARKLNANASTLNSATLLLLLVVESI